MPRIEIARSALECGDLAPLSIGVTISGRRHCTRNREKGHNCEMFGTVLFVRDNQRRFPGRKAHEIR